MKEPLESFMADFQKLQTQNKILDEVQPFYAKYIVSCRQYNELLQGSEDNPWADSHNVADPIIVHSAEQKAHSEDLLFKMNSIVEPFIGNAANAR